MTSLLPSSTSSRNHSASDVGRDLATRRPLVLLATAGGVAAAASTLLVCLAVGVVGWFVTDGGAHGAPRDGLRTGALGWLLAHGSGIRVEGVAVTAVPLGVTALCLWAIWRIGHRVGDSVSGHGPDADAIVDGVRDWTVPAAAALFTMGYVVTAVLTVTLAASETTDPNGARVVLWSLLMCTVLGTSAIAVGSGRAAIWAASLPVSLRAATHTCRRILVTWLALSLGLLIVALVVDFSTAANVMSQLDTDSGDVVLVTALSLAVLPNATLFSGAYLLGPGFSVGAGTLVAPGAVVLGPLPMFPMLAALPDEGPTSDWTAWLIAAPVLVGFVGAAFAQRRRPTHRWEQAAIRGCAGGVLAGVAFGVLATVSGGAVGPGRMREVGPFVLDTLVHAVTAFGIGGLLGALAMTWVQRPTSRLVPRLPRFHRGLRTADDANPSES